MAPNHDKLRSREEIDATDYWEAGITAEAICTLKQGNMDHSQKTCYHCDWKGHIKANCPARKNLYKRPWTKIPMSQEKRATAHKGFGRGRGRGRFIPKRYDTSGRKFTETPKLSNLLRRIFSEGRPKWKFGVGHIEYTRSQLGD